VQLNLPFAQWQSVVSAVDPRLRSTMLYVVSSAGVATVALVEDDLVGVLSDSPGVVSFLAAFPGAVEVDGLTA